MILPSLARNAARLLLTLLSPLALACAQTPAQGAVHSPAPNVAQTATPTSSTPPAEQAAFQQAGRDFDAHHFALALTAFKQLIVQNSGNNDYKKFAAEAALNTGETAFVITTLQPLEQADPADWQARMLLARAYAQTASEPGHRQKRDEEVAEVIRLHLAAPDSKLGKLRDFLLEDIRQGEQSIQFYPALTPWGPYKVHLIARLSSGAPLQPGLRITLESSDSDQPFFAQQHPAEAAAGKRLFSLDGYAPDRKDADGRTVQTHYTYAFFTGEPTYDEVRTRILDIASNKVKPLSSRVGPVD